MRTCAPSLLLLCLTVACLLLCGTWVSAEADITVFDPDTALRLTLFNRAVNCRSERLALWDCGEACSHTPDFVMTSLVENKTYGTRAMIGVDHEHQNVVVAFRGSDNVQNWIADFTFALVPYDDTDNTCGPNCRVHRGFYLAYASVRAGLRSATVAALKQNPTYSVLVTGHSLGGALATLAAADLIEWLPGQVGDTVVVSPTTTTTSTLDPANDDTDGPDAHADRLRSAVPLEVNNTDDTSNTSTTTTSSTTDPGLNETTSTTTTSSTTDPGLNETTSTTTTSSTTDPALNETTSTTTTSSTADPALNETTSTTTTSSTADPGLNETTATSTTTSTADPAENSSDANSLYAGRTRFAVPLDINDAPEENTTSTTTTSVDPSLNETTTTPTPTTSTTVDPALNETTSTSTTTTVAPVLNETTTSSTVDPALNETTTTTTVDPTANETASVVEVQLYTFGSPRVGNAAFAAWVASILPAEKQFRVTNGEDPVPHLPPRVFGYLHTPQEVWYPNDHNTTTYVLCNDSATAEDGSCSRSMKSADLHDHLDYMAMCSDCICGDGDDGNDNDKPSSALGWVMYVYVIMDFFGTFF